MNVTSKISQPEKQFDESVDLSGLNVLVVDDETDSRDFVAFLLTQSGANVTAVASAGEALAALKQLIPDLLVSDIGMPEEDGYMLIGQLRSLAPEQGGLIPAIALTAYASEADRQNILSSGFHRHISKPIDPDDLICAIVNLLGRTNNL